MKQFDYVSAWLKTAVPAFNEIHGSIRILLDIVNRDAAKLRQGDDLSMPWANKLEHRFDSISSHNLSLAAQVIHCFGHWGPSEADASKHGFSEVEREARKISKRLQSNGAYWKFGNYADQNLRKRLGLPKNEKRGHGISFAIVNGVLRVQLSTPQQWQWTEFGFATEVVWAKTPNAGIPSEIYLSLLSDQDTIWNEYVARLIEECSDKKFRSLTNVAQYMVDT